MARRKASSRVPPVSGTTRGRAGAAWESVFLGGSDQTGRMPRDINRQSMIEMPAIRMQAEASTDEFMQHAITMALNGDDEDLLPYQPTPTINPGRPRTLAAGYDEKSMALRIKFRDGEIYTYYQVPPSVWWKFQRAKSPGRYINSTLNRYPYSRGVI